MLCLKDSENSTINDTRNFQLRVQIAIGFRVVDASILSRFVELLMELQIVEQIAEDETASYLFCRPFQIAAIKIVMPQNLFTWKVFHLSDVDL